MRIGLLPCGKGCGYRPPVPIPRFGEQLTFEPAGYLFFGDNLEVLRRHIADESVDLIYLDPPFKSNKSYNLLFEHRDGSKAAGQIKAFDDTWTWSLESARVYDEIVGGGGPPSDMIRGLRAILDTSDMLAYVTMMTPRLIELRRVLKPTGSLYLHCDPTASHYLKVVLDAVFGPDNFRNDIVWKRKAGRGETNNAAIRFGVTNDNLLFFAKSSATPFARQYRESNPEYIASKFTHVDADGRRYRLDNITSPSLRPNLTYEYKGIKPPPKGWAVSRDRMEEMDREGRLFIPSDPRKRIQRKRYLDELEGETVDSLWDDIPPINSQARERLGYPTQKPLALLERIISASTNPGDMVLDPFCGCGTTIDAAQKLGRKWIGIDITEVAIDVIRGRLAKQFGPIDYMMGGEPGTREEAEALARLDKHEFQRWACEKIGITQKVRKGADRGIDGKIIGTFDDGTSWTALVSVKGGKNNVVHLRDLYGTVNRDGAYVGVLITLNPPTAAMKRDAADAGFTEAGQARLQILTVDDLFAGKRPDLPAKAAAAPTQERWLRAV